MRISVVIPTLNEVHHVSLAIESARSQGDCEIIVVDGGSSDGTAAAAGGADRVVIAPRGRAQQQNAGAGIASGDVLLFLHADCRLKPGALESIRHALADERCVGGCFRQSIESPRLKYRLVERGNALRVKLCKWAYGDQGIFVRRAMFQQIGAFPELALMEDLFLMKKLKRAGRVVLLDAEINVSPRRWEKQGVLRQTLRNWLWLTLVHCGVSPNRLAKSYSDVR